MRWPSLIHQDDNQNDGMLECKDDGIVFHDETFVQRLQHQSQLQSQHPYPVMYDDDNVQYCCCYCCCCYYYSYWYYSVIQWDVNGCWIVLKQTMMMMMMLLVDLLNKVNDMYDDASNHCIHFVMLEDMLDEDRMLVKP